MILPNVSLCDTQLKWAPELSSAAIADHVVEQRGIHGDFLVSSRIGNPIGFNDLAYFWHP